MIKLLPIINRLKAAVPSLGGRVAGSAGFAISYEDTLGWQLPHAFVAPDSEEATPNELLGPYAVQEVQQLFAIDILVDNTSDEPGHTAVEQVADIFLEVKTALMGWEPDAQHRQMEYVDGAVVTLNRAVLRWRWTFRTSSEIIE